MYAGLPIVFTVTRPRHAALLIISGCWIAIPPPGPPTLPFIPTPTALAPTPSPARLLPRRGHRHRPPSLLQVWPLPPTPTGSEILTDQPLAFWRLDEPANAPTANDYVGGHNADYYTAYNGLTGFSPAYPAETSTGFGMNGETSGSLALRTTRAPPGSRTLTSRRQGANAQFSARGLGQRPGRASQTAPPSLAKGYGNGGEQYDIEVYGGLFRFFFRNAANNGTRIVTSPNLGPDGTWHHLVGVCDQANGAIRLYVDGVLNATSTTVPPEGLLSPLPASGPILHQHRLAHVRIPPTALLLPALQRHGGPGGPLQLLPELHPGGGPLRGGCRAARYLRPAFAGLLHALPGAVPPVLRFRLRLPAAGLSMVQERRPHAGPEHQHPELRQYRPI